MTWARVALTADATPTGRDSLLFPKTHSLVRFIYIGLAIQAQFVSSGLYRPKFNRTLTPKKSPRKWGKDTAERAMAAERLPS